MKAKADELIHEARQWTQERVLWDWDAASDEVKPLLAEIHHRLFDPAFNVAALERSCRVTQRIRGLFRAELGTTVKRYLTRRKMETMRWLVENSDLEARVFAEAFGYSDPTNFSRDFTAWAKRTPTAVRSAVRPSLSPGRHPTPGATPRGHAGPVHALGRTPTNRAASPSTRLAPAETSTTERGDVLTCGTGSATVLFKGK